MKNILNTAHYLMDSAFISTCSKVIASVLLSKYRVGAIYISVCWQRTPLQQKCRFK